jgi:hypothetical protein
MTHDRATAIVRTRIIPAIAAAFEAHPERGVGEVLALCRAPLETYLREEFADERRQAVADRSLPDA